VNPREAVGFFLGCNAFFELAERFRAASDPKEVKQLGRQMGRFIFGE